MRVQTKRRRLGAIILSLAATMAVVWHAPAAAPLFSTLEGFATKTGFRGVFAWQATQPVKAVVTYGTSADDLGSAVITIPGAPDSAGMAIADGLEPGMTYYWQVEDILTGEKSDVSSFTASNAYNDWNGTTYTLDLLVQLDAESLPPDIPWDLASQDIAAGVNIFAERLYDAMDGFARLGDVIITDTQTEYAGSVPAVPTVGCDAVPGAGGNLADVLVQTTVPFDSHTFGGWAIDDPCTSFYVGRIGWLVVPWADDLMFGATAVHEMMHYAFNAPDLYPANSDADCVNPSWDGSVMHNTGGWNGKRWELTELDRNEKLTPCDHGTKPYTWKSLRERYTNVPERPDGPIEHIIDSKARGNPDGGALDIKILDRNGPYSSLTSFTPDDTDPKPDCTQVSGPVATDATGDSNGGVSPREAALDIHEAALEWAPSNGEMTMEISVVDLGPTNPGSAPDIGFNLDFVHADQDLYVRAGRSVAGLESFSLVKSPNSVRIAGRFNDQEDTVSFTIASGKLTQLGVKEFAAGDRVTPGEIISYRPVNGVFVPSGFVADSTNSSCSFVVGHGTTPEPPPAPPVPDVELNHSSLMYEWQGSRSTNVKEEPLLGEDIFGCEGIEGPGCEEIRILVSAPGVLEVSIEGETPEVNDFDLYLYDSNGREVDRSAEEGGAESVSVTVTATEVYRVAVHAWLTVDASYEGVAHLRPSGPAPGLPTQGPSASPPPPENKAPEKEAVRTGPDRPSDPPEFAGAVIHRGPLPATNPPSLPGLKAKAGPTSETPAKGVSTTTSLSAAAAALLTGLAAGYALARRR